MTVLGKTEAPKTYKTRAVQYWSCRCDCGNTIIVTTGNLNFYTRRLTGGCRACSPRRNKYRLGRHKSTPEFRLWEVAKRRAKKKGIPFDITPEDVVIPKVCPLLGVKLTHLKMGWDGNTPSLDRKSPVLGYTKGNIWVISFRANLLKNDASTAELEGLVERLKSYGIE